MKYAETLYIGTNFITTFRKLKNCSRLEVKNTIMSIKFENMWKRQKHKKNELK